jgi:uncharacterized membrane protein YfcA
LIPLFAAIIALLALFVRGFSGFGAALVMMPILMLFLDVQTAVVAVALTQVPVGFLIAFHSRSAIDRSSLTLLLPPSLLGIIVGLFVLVTIDNDLLKRVFGVITVFFAIRIMLALRDRDTGQRKWPANVGFLAGALGGVFGGIFGTSGPPVIVYLEQQISSKDVLRATLLAYFLAVDGLRLGSYALSGLVTRQAVGMGMVMIPAALIGAYWGTRLNARVDEHAFRVAVGTLLLVAGVLLAVGR